MRLLMMVCLLLNVRNPALALQVRIVSAMALPGYPSRLILTPDGRELYILQPHQRLVLVMQTATGQITHQLRTGERPTQVAAAPDGSHVFVGCQNAVLVISSGDKKTVEVPGAQVEDLSVSRDSRTVYLAMGWQGVQKMDVSTHRISIMNPTSLAMALALTPDGRFLYVNYQGRGPGGAPGHDAIGKLDANTGALLRSIRGLANVGDRMVVSPDGRFVWASGLDACYSRAYDHVGCPAVPAGIVNVLETATDKLVRRIPWIGGSFPQDLTFSRDGRLLVMSGGAPRFFDTRTFEVLTGLPDLLTGGMAINADGRRAYASVQHLQVAGRARAVHQLAVLEILP